MFSKNDEFKINNEVNLKDLDRRLENIESVISNKVEESVNRIILDMFNDESSIRLEYNGYGFSEVSTLGKKMEERVYMAIKDKISELTIDGCKTEEFLDSIVKRINEKQIK